MEHVLHRHHLGLVQAQLSREPLVQEPELLLDAVLSFQRKDAVRHVHEAGAAAVLDGAEAAEPRAGDRFRGRSRARF
jgi:hypothetical protein